MLYQTRLPPPLHHKVKFAYEWPLAHRADAVPGMARGLLGGLGLDSHRGHDADGGMLGQALWGSLALRCTVMGGIRSRTKGRAAVRVACYDAVAGLVVRGVEQTLRAIRAVMGLFRTRTHRDAQHLHAIDRRSPSLLPGVGHDDTWYLYEPLLGEVLQWSVVCSPVLSTQLLQ